jgi:hypothetical protein
MGKQAGRLSTQQADASRAGLVLGGRIEAREADIQGPKRRISILSVTARKTGGKTGI